MNPPAQCWRLQRQANHELASRLPTTASRAEPGDPDGWAARVLAVARQRGLVDARSIAELAEVIALTSRPPGGRGRDSAAQTTPAFANRLRYLAVALHEGSLSRATTASPAAPVVRLRSEDAARRAYNYPTHWVRSEGGKLVPEANLQGHAAWLWGGLASEFGLELAQSMFDGHVKGGLLAVIAAMDTFGSSKPLTSDHLGALHFVALTHGRPIAGQFDGEMPKPNLNHDPLHVATGFGSSRFEETYNELSIKVWEGSLPLFDAKQPVLKQQNWAAAVKEQTAQGLAALDFKVLFKINFDGLRPRLKAIEYAQLIEASAELDGSIAHLNADERSQFQSMHYSQARVQTGHIFIDGNNAFLTLEELVTRFERGGDGAGAQWDRDAEAWSKRVCDFLVNAARRRLLPELDARQSAARLVALKVCMASGLPVNLRLEFPRVLRDVQQALGLPP
jgi:hypothetical protein